MKKDLHIVFGDSAKASFNQGHKFNKNKIKLICLQDPLDFGPVCDLYSIEEIKKRSNWLSEIYEKEVPIDKILNEDIEKIKTLVDTYENENIYIWMGYSTVDEILNTARLLFHLPKSCKNIFIMDFLNYSPNGIPKNLGETSPCQIDEMAKHFYHLSEEDLLKFVQLWERIKSGSSVLRILGNDGQILEKEESYYDSIILSYCTDKFQNAATILGKTMAVVYIQDVFLLWRIKQLILQGKIEARKNSSYIGFEVRLATKL